MKKLLLSILFLVTPVFASKTPQVLNINTSSVRILPSILKRKAVVHSVSPKNFEVESDYKKTKKDKKKVRFIESMICKKVMPRVPAGYCPTYFTCMGVDFRVLKSNKEVQFIKPEILSLCVTP